MCYITHHVRLSRCALGPLTCRLAQYVTCSSMQMLVDDIGDVTTTNDGATILKLLEVEHPAAKARPGWLVCGMQLEDRQVNGFFRTRIGQSSQHND